jgi:release factor glutamine methyltransferase
MNFKDFKYAFRKELGNIYSKDESDTILSYILIDAIGIPKLRIISEPQMELDDIQSQKILDLLNDLKKGIPIQHLLGITHFYGLILKVGPEVLIPRQETEELVNWVITDYRDSRPKILDACTGSGCIALSLKKNLPESFITGIDISEKAIELAKENAENLNLEVSFKKANVLNLADEMNEESFDVIVSNPPYIPLSEKDKVQRNVFMYEPHLALFVPDETSFIFYESIARYAVNLKSAKLYFEIYEESGDAMMELMKDLGFRDIILKQDLNGKNRMLRCCNF